MTLAQLEPLTFLLTADEAYLLAMRLERADERKQFVEILALLRRGEPAPISAYGGFIVKVCNALREPWGPRDADAAAIAERINDTRKDVSTWGAPLVLVPPKPPKYGKHCVGADVSAAENAAIGEHCDEDEENTPERAEADAQWLARIDYRLAEIDKLRGNGPVEDVDRELQLALDVLVDIADDSTCSPAIGAAARKVIEALR